MRSEAKIQDWKDSDSVNSKSTLRLWLRLLTATTLIEKQIRNYLQNEFGTTLPRFDVLAALERSPDGLTMSELSNRLLVSNGNVTGLVARLQEDGLVKRTQSKDDGRSFRVCLTRKGKNLFVPIAAQHETFVETMLADLSPRQTEVLIELLEDVHRSAKKSIDERS